MEARRIIGWNVRKIRVEKNLTMEELADRADVDFSSLARLERGVLNATIGIIEKLARALDARLVDLVAEPPKGAKPPKPLTPSQRASKRR